MEASITNCEYQVKYRWIFLENRLFQTPWMILKLLFGLIHTAFVFLFCVKDPTDSDIVQYVENTTMALFIRPTEGGLTATESHDSFTFSIEKCLVESWSFRKINNIKMLYTKGRNNVSIEKFIIDGKTVTNRETILETLFFYHTACLHTKFHLYSNSLTEYIVDHDNMETFYPSTRTSIPLHMALTTLPISPVSNLQTATEQPWVHRFVTRVYTTDITRESLVRESENPAILNQIPHLMESGHVPIIRYLAQCKNIVETAVSEENLPPSLVDPFFFHIVVHAVDHASCYNHTWNLRFGIGSLKNHYSGSALFRSIMFRYMMVKPSLNPFLPNTLKRLNSRGGKKGGFYPRIYEGIKSLDSEFGFDFADLLTASIMF